MTYAVPLKVTIRLVVWNKDPETGVKTIRDIKEQEVYFGDIPLMTENGSSSSTAPNASSCRSCTGRPGVLLFEDKTHTSAIIPYRGSWVELSMTRRTSSTCARSKRKFLASACAGSRGGRDHPRVLQSTGST
jgi:DNA-directed RNA polymerase subunit beta